MTVTLSTIYRRTFIFMTVLALAWIKLYFSAVAYMGVSFGFVMKIALITH